jgi:hypothetical protein
MLPSPRIVNAPLIIAGSLAILGAAIHGGAGEVLVVRKLSPEVLAPSPFGGPKTTKLMIHVTWHLTTIAFLAVGVALVLSGSVLDGATAQGIALVAAGTATGFAAVMLGMGVAYTKSPRIFVRHPGPVIFAAIAVLAWLGAL